MGLAFQIKDDLFDYGTEEIGKPRGIDIKEKKLTLPLIHALSNSSYMEKRRIKGVIKSHSEDKKSVQEVIDFVKKKEGIKYAIKKMHEIKSEAENILMEFPEGPSRDSLLNLVTFTIDRKK